MDALKNLGVQTEMYNVEISLNKQPIALIELIAESAEKAEAQALERVKVTTRKA